MVTDAQILEILCHPLDHEWQVQGLGMLRTYLDAEGVERLHIWGRSVALTGYEADVSTIHDHPWDFTSSIRAGHMVNQRYDLFPYAPTVSHFKGFTAAIKCGAGGGLLGEPTPTYIMPYTPENCYPGDRYTQEAVEFHESLPVPGTVTTIRRTFHAERDVAHVAWYRGGWVSAEPRPATQHEIELFVALALGVWKS